MHVAVLTAAGMTDQDDTGPSPWVQRTDRLEFPAEWVITADVRRREDVAREMRHLIDRIRHQAHHITVEHSQPAPLSLDRQMQAARRIEDESQTGPEAFAGRIHAWARIAVAGETEAQALERARRVAELYAPGITVVHTPGQYALAREFIPGEPLADFGHRRPIETAALAAGMPNASASAGHRHGFPIGVTTSTAVRAVTLHPWHGMEQLNHSGLITVTGTLGGGKSSLAGLLAYMAVRAGITTVVLDQPRHEPGMSTAPGRPSIPWAGCPRRSCRAGGWSAPARPRAVPLPRAGPYRGSHRTGPPGRTPREVAGGARVRRARSGHAGSPRAAHTPAADPSGRSPSS